MSKLKQELEKRNISLLSLANDTLITVEELQKEEFSMFDEMVIAHVLNMKVSELFPKEKAKSSLT